MTDSSRGSNDRATSHQLIDTEGRHHNSKYRHHGRNGHKDESGEKPSTSLSTIVSKDGDAAGPFFFVDRKGDPQNVFYGGNTGGTVPRYHKLGSGSLIGAGRRYRISADGSKAFNNSLTGDDSRRSHAKSLYTLRNYSKLGQDQTKAEVLENIDDAIKLQHAYIPFGAKRRKGDTSQTHMEQTLDIALDRQQSYRESGEIDTHTPSDAESRSDISTEGEPDAYDTFRNDFHRQRAIELHRATKERPGDPDAWLALISHAAHNIGPDNTEHTDQLSVTDKHNLAETRLALYEKALKEVVDPVSRVRLMVGKLDQAALIWDAETLLRKWKAVVKGSHSAPLWIRYLNFRQTASTSLSYEECLSTHRECLKRAFTEADTIQQDELSIYVLLRATTCMSQSGYAERATAIWQGLLEFTFFKPNHFEEHERHSDHSKHASSLRTFWEKEIPRIGEPGAAGWAHSKSVDVPPKSDAFPEKSVSDDVYENWALREREAAISSILPARTLDNVAGDDPFRVILFSDISDYLYRPSTTEGSTMLLDAFLRFCGLPALHSPGLGPHRKWWADPFLSVNIHQGQESDGGVTSITNTMTLFSSENAFTVFPLTQSCNKEGLVWQRMALRQLVNANTDDDTLAEYLVAFEASLDLKEARKYAKHLLKDRPTNLRLYNAYALLECRLERFANAEHIWATAMSMSSNMKQGDVALVWSSWLLQCLQRGMLPKSRHLLLSIPEGRLSECSPELFREISSRIRVRSYLDAHLAQQMSLRQEEGVLHDTELLAIFDYLASSQSLTSALAVYSTTLDALAETATSSNLIELIHQSRARLLYLHPRLSPQYKPNDINKTLAESLRLFPHNSMFHQLYQEHTRRSGLLERIREAVPARISSSENYEHDTSITPLIFTIKSEISRPSYAGSTHNSTRAAFERAVAAAKSCVSIWAWYIRWEASLSLDAAESQKARRRSSKRELGLPENRAVNVYYRAIRACPLNKELHLLAFTEASLRSAISESELRKIHEGMVDMGLRMHFDLDEELNL